MSDFSTADAAKEYGAKFMHAKVWGQMPPASEPFTDYDPGTDGPTDPSPPPDDPTKQQVEDYLYQRNERSMWVIKNAWEKGQP